MSDQRPLINQIKSNTIEIEGRKYDSSSPYVDLEQDDISTSSANNFIPVNDIFLKKTSLSEIEDIKRITSQVFGKNDESSNNLVKKFQKDQKEIIDLSDCSQTNINNISTMNFQSSKNNHSNISHISIKIKEEPNLNNFSYHIQYNPSQTDNHDMFIYLKIKDFDKFLNIQRAYETGLFKFYIPRWDLNLIGKATLIPNLEKKNFSLKIDIVEDNRLDQFSYQEKEMDLSNVSHFSNKVNKNNNEFSLLEEIQEETSFTRDKKKNVFGKKKAKSKARNQQEETEPINEEHNSYINIFSERVQKILNDNNVTFEYLYGFFNKSAKTQFPKQSKGKLTLNQSNIVYLEDLYELSELIYDGIINPLIVRVKLNLPGKLYSETKCEEYMGFINEGNTCYANSVIQSIYHIPILRKAAYVIPSQEETPLFHIQKIFYQLQANKGKIQKPELFKSLNWKEWNRQQDAQEFFTSIFDLLSETEKIMLESQAIISEKCEGIIESNVKCIEFNKESSTKEKFHFLQLDLENCDDLVQCIEKYISVEYLSGENQYLIENCGKYDAIKSSRYVKIPEIVFLHLKRFKSTPDLKSMTKVHSRISYPYKIDFSSYYETKVDDIIHCLYGVIVHDGLIDCGHYFVFLRDFKNNRWLKFNDTKVSIVCEEEVFDKNFGGEEPEIYVTNIGEIVESKRVIERTAYMLIYVQENKLQNLFCEVTEKDIPESLMEIMSPPLRKGRTSINSSFNNNNKNIYQSNYPGSFKIFDDKNKNKPYSDVSSGNFDKKRNTVFKNFQFLDKNLDKEAQNGNFPNITNIDQLNNFLHVGTGYKPVGKVKDNERNIEDKSSTNKNIMSSEIKYGKRSKNLNNNLVHQIINNKPKTKTNSDIEIAIQLENNSFANNQTMPHSTTSKIDIKKFVSANKSLIRKFKMKFVEDNGCKFIDEVEVDSQLDKKILCMDFMNKCYGKIKNSSEIDIMKVKLVLSNNMGIFIKIIGESDQIEELLCDYLEKKVQLMFYVFNEEDLVSFSESFTLAVHLMPSKFREITDIINVHELGGFKPELPIILKNDKTLENLENLTREIYKIIKRYKPISESKLKNSKSKNLIENILFDL
jgi:hypothetical protein